MVNTILFALGVVAAVIVGAFLLWKLVMFFLALLNDISGIIFAILLVGTIAFLVTKII